MKQKKIQLEKSKSSAATKHSNLTVFISKTLNSRQEEVPLLEEHITKAKAEPLHLKNNVVKEHFMKLFQIVFACNNIAVFKSFKEIPPQYTLPKFIEVLRHKMDCNFLSKKLLNGLMKILRRMHLDLEEKKVLHS